MNFSLPYPPTINTYWRSVQGRVLISKKGRDYRAAVTRLVSTEPQVIASGMMKCRVSITMLVFPPDRRRRDIDNLPKAVLDSLEFAGVFENDSQVDRLLILRQSVEAPAGRIELLIEEYKAGDE